MNIELTHKALAKVGNAHILVNLISRRVRQLNSGGPSGRALIEAPVNASASDIALLELIHDKLGWSFTDAEPVAEPGNGAKRKRTRKAAEPA